MADGPGRTEIQNIWPEAGQEEEREPGRLQAVTVTTAKSFSEPWGEAGANPSSLWVRAGYSLDCSPIHHWPHTETNRH